jgi:hypothetical protein
MRLIVKPLNRFAELRHSVPRSLRLDLVEKVEGQEAGGIRPNVITIALSITALR